jgi:PAS domain S-box-containing protein
MKSPCPLHNASPSRGPCFITVSLGSHHREISVSLLSSRRRQSSEIQRQKPYFRGWRNDIMNCLRRSMVFPILARAATVAGNRCQPAVGLVRWAGHDSMLGQPFGLASRDDHFRLFLEALPVAVYTTDASGLITSFNQAAADLVGRSPQIGRDRWCVTWRAYWPDGRPMQHEDCPMAVALRENRAIRGVEAIGERPDGTRFPFIPHPTPVRTASGAVEGGINVLVEVTNHKTTSHIRNALILDLEKKEAAILGLVGAVLRETQRQARSTEAQELIEQAIRRVATISATQSFLYDPNGTTRINSWNLLSAICITAQMPVQDCVELVCECSADDLASETAMPLVLVAKELIANAAKHGLVGRAKMVVRVGLRKEFDGYVFSVEDDGPGFTLQAAHLRSSGLRLVTMLARQLNGTFEVDGSRGARCVVRFPDPRSLH